jgi:hypothetical protein
VNFQRSSPDHLATAAIQTKDAHSRTDQIDVGFSRITEIGRGGQAKHSRMLVDFVRKAFRTLMISSNVLGFGARKHTYSSHVCLLVSGDSEMMAEEGNVGKRKYLYVLQAGAFIAADVFRLFPTKRCWMGLRASKSGRLCVRKWRPLSQHFLASENLRSVLSLCLLHNPPYQYQTTSWFYFIVDLSIAQFLFSPCFHLYTALLLHASPVPCYYKGNMQPSARQGLVGGQHLDPHCCSSKDTYRRATAFLHRLLTLTSPFLITGRSDSPVRLTRKAFSDLSQ